MNGSLSTRLRDVPAEDLAAAVEAGVLDESRALALVEFIATRTVAPSTTVDEENVRLITSFNDLFVTIGIGLVVGAVISIAGRHSAPLIAILAWGLAEIFTRRRRMAFPSIILAAVFVAACGWSAYDAIDAISPHSAPIVGGIIAFIGGFIHWKRFGVPISVAAMTAAGLLAADELLKFIAPNMIDSGRGVVVFVFGLAVFAGALRWDASDRERRTRRADVAFWLHILAAPMIVHSLAWSVAGVRYGSIPQTTTVPLVLLLAVLAIVALVVDRRALLVSALIYLGGLLVALIRGAGIGGSMDISLAVGLVGATVLLLSIGWTPLRRFILRFVPAAVRAHVPAAHPAEGQSS